MLVAVAYCVLRLYNIVDALKKMVIIPSCMVSLWTLFKVSKDATCPFLYFGQVLALSCPAVEGFFIIISS